MGGASPTPGADAEPPAHRHGPITHAHGSTTRPRCPRSARVVDLEGWRSIGEGKGPNRGYPDTLIGVLGRGTVFLSDRRRWKDFDLWSGQRIHVVRLWYATAVTGPDVNTVEADGVILGGAIFPNQSAWTKFGHPEWRVRNATDQLGEGWSLDFKKITKSRFNIGNGLVLEVEPTW